MLDECVGDKPAFCRNYARTAVEQDEENLRRGCGFEGGRWHSDYDMHYNWCMEVPQEDAESENRIRQELLDGCIKPGRDTPPETKPVTRPVAKPDTKPESKPERVTTKPTLTTVIPDSQKIRLAVIEFKEVDSISQTNNLGTMVSEIFTTEVVNSDAFKIVEREQLQKILQEHTIVQIGIVDTTQAQKLGKMLGADAIITGSVMKIGQKLRIDARVIEVKTGIIVSAESRLCNEELNEISRNVSEITRGLAEKFYK
jgi:TolB-like protein